MDKHGEEFEDNDDEGWSLPFNDDTCTSPSGISNVGSPGSRVNNPDWKHKERQHRLSSNSADLCISTLGHTRTIIHIDIDCFYAQVEMIRNPKLRDKPLGVQQKYLVVTCNYVARGYGVTKLTGVKDALDKCPDLVLVSGEDLTHYRQVSYRISEFLQQYTSHVERLGMDENFLDVSDLVKQRLESGHSRSEVRGHEYTLEHDNGNVEDDKRCKGRLAVCACGCHERLTVGSQIAADIRDALRQELDITCCAGISYNKLLSKLVAGKHKPNQQTTLFPEQTAHFMAAVGQVGRIPGIGSTTSKKLAALGIVSLQDLQQFGLSDLKQELGPKQAVVIQQLSFGIDDSPIVTFGRPQTLSDEDSFKKCSTVKDARSKVKELLYSLIKRLLDDGRTPQTLRLTIRKLTTADKKWTNRESRQCPIPGHVMSSLTSDKVERLIDQLEEITMTLFTKLVNTKEPFHLTLMNIAFCSLVEKSKNAISSFFTVRSPRNEADNGNTPGDSPVGQKSVVTTSIKGKQPNILQKWVLKSPEKSRNISQKVFPGVCEEGSTNVSRSPQGCLSCHKRKAEEGIEDTKSHTKRRSLGRNISGDSLGRSPEEAVCHIPGRRSSEANLSIPNDLDMDIFLQLPSDIQREILQEAKSRKGKTCSIEVEKNTRYEQLDSNSNMDSNNIVINNSSTSCVRASEESCSQGSAGQKWRKASLPPRFSVRESSIPSDNHLEHSEGVKLTGLEDNPLKQSTSTHWPSDYIENIQTYTSQSSVSGNLTESVLSNTEEQSGDILNRKTNTAGHSETNVWEETGYVASNIDVCESDNSVSQSYQLPPHIDKEVFSNLPSDIQKEYLCQWSRVPTISPVSQGRQSITKHNSTVTTSQGRQPNSKHKPNVGKTSILNFFQSKNKK